VLGVSVLVLAPAASATVSYGFTLNPPNIAEDPDTGDVIRVTGAGTFDTGGAVNGGGVFTHRDSDGDFVARGTWRATGFVDFDSFGGPSNGIQGGVLAMTATLFPVGGAPVTGVPITIICLVGIVPPGTGEEGTTVGEFTEVLGGFTVFHLMSS
jgi:hypothetical protein